MGYKTEINYILKSNNQVESDFVKSNLIPGSVIIIKKSGFRTFILNAPIMFADFDWNILGMCSIQKSTVTKSEIILEAVVLTVLTENESKIVTKVIQDAEKVKPA